jgi:prevent-host-death family protein
MKTVGVRELRQNPTPVLEEVGRGETFVITVQNRPVAQIVPVKIEHRGAKMSEILQFRWPDDDPTFASDIRTSMMAEDVEDPWETAR